MHKRPRNHHAERVFADWLVNHRLRREGVTYTEYKIRCEAGEIDGLSPNATSTEEESGGGSG